MKKRIAESAEALMQKAEECLDIAKAQHDSADKLETIVDSLITEAAVLNGAALVTAGKNAA